VGAFPSMPRPFSERPKRWATAAVVGDAEARGEADPPFDFAQGRLFGDDNQKGKGKSKSLVVTDGLHPTLRDGTAKDGAPVLLWLSEMGLATDLSFDFASGQRDVPI
jgi:hypothetical protein